MPTRPTPLFQVRYYQTDTGNVPVQEFLEELEKRDPKAAAKCQSYTTLLMEQGMSLLSKHQYVEKVADRDDLYELRPECKNVEYRLYFTILGSSVAFVMVHALKKHGRKPPKRDLDLAEKRAREIQRGEAKKNDRA